MMAASKEVIVRRSCSTRMDSALGRAIILHCRFGQIMHRLQAHPKLGAAANKERGGQRP
jgi:hypothetical protein